MEISPFDFFFRSVFNLLFKKNINREFFSIQNGEISILNGDFSIHFFSDLFFKKIQRFFLKKISTEFFSIQNGEISILNGDFSIHFFSEAFSTFFEKISTENFGEISIQNGDFSILNGENSLLIFFLEKEVSKTLLKKVNREFLHSE